MNKDLNVSMVEDEYGKEIGKHVKNGKSRYCFHIPNFPVAIYVNNIHQYTTRGGRGGEIRTVENIKPLDTIKLVRSGLFTAKEVVAEISVASRNIEYSYDVVDMEGKTLIKNSMWQTDY